MNKEIAEQQAVTLIKQYCPEYAFKWNDSISTFGLCYKRRKVIALSLPLTELNVEEEVKDTILHEIAHALDAERGHGEKWKEICRKIGAKPIRCFSDDIQKPNRTKYIYSCPNCKREIKRTNKIRKNKTACGKCCKGKWCKEYMYVLKEKVTA